jgi:hypothetical protein
MYIDDSKVERLITKMISMLTTVGLTPLSHPLFPILVIHERRLFDSIRGRATPETLDETIRVAATIVECYSTLLCYGHPPRGHALAALGKYLAIDVPATPANWNQKHTFPPYGPPRLKLAYETLLKARDELLVGFGTANEGGLYGKMVRDLIIPLERELGVWDQGIRNVLEDTLRSQAK